MPIAAGLYYQEINPNAPQPVPLVLIHGAGGSHLSWPAEMRRIPGFRILALDLPGHGRSEGSGKQSIPAYSAIVIAWLQALDIPKAVLIGHSMGAAIALQMAAQPPTPAPPDHRPPPQFPALVLFGAAARLTVNPDLFTLTASDQTYLTAVDLVTRWSFGPATPQPYLELAGKRMAQTRRTVLHGDFLACDNFNLVDQLSAISQPTLVVCGEADKMTTPRQARFLAETLPNARLEILPGAGHMVMLEQPAVSAKLVQDFLAQIV